MASFGFEPFDDDEAIDWICNLDDGDFKSLQTQLKDSPQHRKTWAALGLLSSLINPKITLPNGLANWRKHLSALKMNLVDLAKARVEEVCNCVNNELEPDNVIHDMARDEWNLIRSTLLETNSLEQLSVQSDSNTELDESTDFVCAYCNEEIQSSALLNISLIKNGPVGIEMHAHEACFSKHLQDGVKTLLDNL